MTLATQSEGSLPRLMAQSFVRLLSLQTPATSLESPGHPHFWAGGYEWRVFHDPLKFDNSLGWLTELRKVLFL